MLVDDFRPSDSQRRALRANADLVGAFVAPKPTNEHYSLFRSYLDARHPEGGMADMSSLDFAMMVEDTHIDTVLTEYRARSGTGDAARARVRCSPSASPTASPTACRWSIPSTIPTSRAARSAAIVILDHIEKARRLGLPHVYLGYWVEGSKKMGYKAGYLPQERLGLHGWARVER